MTPLRQKMIDAMTLKGYSEHTHKSYLYHIEHLARHFNQSPDQLGMDELRAYLLYCHNIKNWSFSSCRQFVHAARFFYGKVLGITLSKEKLPFPKKEQKIPELLSVEEVRRIIEACNELKYQTSFYLAYGAGLRVSELARLRVSDLDSERNVIRIEQSKGYKDRNVSFTEGIKQCLRYYWQEYRPSKTVFYGQQRSQPLKAGSFQKAYIKAKLKAGVRKAGGIHALRHAYATHQLEKGMLLPQLQQQLGHNDIRTTLRYTHWVSDGLADKSDLLTSMLKP